MILFLPPAPHTAAFFDTIRGALADIETQAATYPGYGDVPKTKVSIEAYAEHLLPQDGTVLIGFHTGCLVAIEMTLQSPDIGGLILIDIPYFDDTAKAKYSVKLDADNPKDDAFRAAFAYDLDDALSQVSLDTICIATDSFLLGHTREAAHKFKRSQFIERRDISKPAFESEAMAQLIRDLVS